MKTKLIARKTESGWDVWFMSCETGEPYRVLRGTLTDLPKKKRGECESIGPPSFHVDEASLESESPD